MMFYKNTKEMIRSSDSDTNFLDTVTGVLQGDRYIRPIHVYNLLNYVLQTSKDLIKKIILKKGARNRWYPVETMTDADFSDYLVVLVNTPAQTESRQHSLEERARGIGLYVNVDKTEFMCFKQK